MIKTLLTESVISIVIINIIIIITIIIIIIIIIFNTQTLCFKHFSWFTLTSFYMSF